MEPTTPQGSFDAALNQTVISSLSNHIAQCYTDAQTAKTDVIERLLECERQRRGEYSPQMKQLIAQAGGQEIYVMLTDIKCRAADSWIKDVVMNHAESTWTLEPGAEPDLSPEDIEDVKLLVQQEAAEVAAMDIPVDAEAMAEREREVREEAKSKVVELAAERCNAMERRITDKLQEGGWKAAYSAMIYDFTTYPAVFLKGPIIRKKKKLTWGPDNKPIVQEREVIEVDRISPFDIFPSKGAVTIQDGTLIHRHRLSRKAIKMMKGLPGVNDDAITDVLWVYRNGLKQTINGDSEHELLKNGAYSFGSDGLIEALEYWGPASGQMLIEWGMKTLPNGQAIDAEDEYQINAWKVGSYVIRAQLNPDPLDQRPYSKACFEDIPGSFWGKSLPEMMQHCQTLVNAAARSLASNMGIASGPQVEVQVDRLPAGAKVTSMFPWKVWQTTSDRSGAGHPAVRFFQPDMNAQELLGIETHYSKQADEVTGVPNYIYGSSNVSGAGRTASGLSMLMENAAKGIKHAILGLDAAVTEMIVRIYNHLMIYDPDQSIKGDMNIVAAGAIGAMIREQQAIARKEFMVDTLNPVDVQIIGTEGRAHMLRERAKSLFSDVNKVVPSAERMKAVVAQQQAAILAAQQQPPGAPAQQPA